MAPRTAAIWAGLWLLAASNCYAGPAQSQCAAGGQDCSVVAPKQHVVKTRAYWDAAFSKPVEDRFGAAAPEVIDFMTQDNIRNGISKRPRGARLTPDFERDARQALVELPERVRRLLHDKLAGVYFAEDFGGTGWTDTIEDADGNERTGFVVLDSAVLRDKIANTWFTWKENTPFQPRSGIELKGEIEARVGDNRKNAIQYILLHELGHILSIGEDIHPSWTIEPKDVRSTAGYRYFSLSWTLAPGSDKYASVYDAAFPERRDVVFYFGAKLAASRMLDIYRKLETTNFPTLYGATGPGDDWAEAFVTYVHTVMMNKPLAIRIYQDGKLAKEFRACWSQKRCEQKRRIIERFIGVH